MWLLRARNSFVFLAVFAAAAFAAHRVPSPFRDGPLLDIVPERPPALRAEEPHATAPDTVISTVDLAPPALAASATEDGSGGAGSPDPLLRALAVQIRLLARTLGDPVVALERPCLDAAADAEGSVQAAGTANEEACHHRALDAYFAQLTDVALRRADHPARASVFGDSLVMGDGFCGELRRLLGAQFGDGGHGFVYMANPERQLGAEDLVLQLSDDFTSQAVVYGGRADHLYGLAGAAFTHDGNGTWGARLPAEGFGSRVERVGYLLFAKVPGASARFTFDDDARTVDLGIDDDSSGLAWVDVPEGTHRIRLGALPRDAIHYGVILENHSGTVVDNLGLVSSRMQKLLRIDGEQFAEHLRLRDAELNVFFYGANSAPPERSTRAEQEHLAEYAGVLARVELAVPEADCLVMSLLTRGGWVEGEIVSYRSIEGIVQAQRQSAMAAGCAFFDAYTAIGGDAGASRWYHASPQLLGSDLAHPTRTGYRELASMFYVALIDAYADYLDERLQREAR